MTDDCITQSNKSNSENSSVIEWVDNDEIGDITSGSNDNDDDDDYDENNIHQLLLMFFFFTTRKINYVYVKSLNDPVHMLQLDILYNLV
jgi:hypothetical protein